MVIGMAGSLGSRRLLLISNMTNSGEVYLVVALGLNYLLNLLHLYIYKRYICMDAYFNSNKKNISSKILNTILLIVATLTNFRVYQIVFSSMCNLRIFRTRLMNLSKLTPLNLLNCANIIFSLLAIVGASFICT
jgi:hypothetical protein